MAEHHFQHEGYKVIWDNRCVLHHAIHDYHLQRRRMERTTIASDQPFGMDAPS
jgi:alpha-ketoglutarate-dependent taurine dioxygenase